ncbi:hypothetical protein UG55_100317 [Frankia sp. EI5c]|uniref:YbaB/EbfC family nucleoid-associated protein n=1 Tax=Frankia sp. EI5c TaxID=683316 RepID=UPI0007C2DFA2|nr:YbaB/EbfC family nucleoid-associated protein [Frankia sp. EI5c]OAA29206.1 hypothetical protein UG55_100317 [Frankia sp. EI5c]
MLFGEDEMEAALAQLARIDETASRILEQGSGLRETATDRNRTVSVTVDGRGEVHEVHFRGEAYRDLAPAELADLLVRTIGQARRAAREKALAGLADLPLAVPPVDGDLADPATADAFAADLMAMFSRNMTGRRED